MISRTSDITAIFFMVNVYVQKSELNYHILYHILLVISIPMYNISYLGLPGTGAIYPKFIILILY